MVDYSISLLRTLYLPGSSVYDDPGKYKKSLITNCVINRIMSILFSF